MPSRRLPHDPSHLRRHQHPRNQGRAARAPTRPPHRRPVSADLTSADSNQVTQAPRRSGRPAAHPATRRGPRPTTGHARNQDGATASARLAPRGTTHVGWRSQGRRAETARPSLDAPRHAAEGRSAIPGAGLALAVNRALGRKGRVVGDRYHARPLTTPRQMRTSMVYVCCSTSANTSGRPPASTRAARGRTSRGGSARPQPPTRSPTLLRRRRRPPPGWRASDGGARVVRCGSRSAPPRAASAPNLNPRMLPGAGRQPLESADVARRGRQPLESADVCGPEM